MARSAKLELAEGLRHDYARIRRLQRATGDHCGSTADRALSSAEALGDQYPGPNIEKLLYIRCHIVLLQP